MRPTRCDWCSSEKETVLQRETPDVYAEGRLSEDTVRRSSSVSQGESPRETRPVNSSNLLALELLHSGFVGTYISVVQSTHSETFCYCSPRKLP